jgi:N-acetylglucosaminyldiphosphoundecaprenol N-acetyl-beta-D-mannosaminyltransferase
MLAHENQNTSDVPRAGHGAVDMKLPRIDLGGVPIAALTEARVVEIIVDELDAGRGGWVITMNLDILRRWSRDSAIRELCSRASLIVADGMPLVWAAQLRRTALPERVAGSNLITSLSARAARRGRSIFLLGGDHGTAQAAADALKERCPDLRVCGTFCPPLGFEEDPSQMQAIRSAVRDAAPDIVYVALGFPKQERLIQVLREGFPCTWWLGVGISFSFVCGRVRRAPAWMQRTGLEWVHRLLQEPRRLARRYLIDDVPFAMRLLASCAWHGLRNGR